MLVYLRLQNLPATADNVDVRRFFYGFDIPESGVCIIGGRDQEAFVAFRCVYDSLRALNLDRQYLMGQQVRLCLGKDADMERVVRKRLAEMEQEARISHTQDADKQWERVGDVKQDADMGRVVRERLAEMKQEAPISHTQDADMQRDVWERVGDVKPDAEMGRVVREREGETEQDLRIAHAQLLSDLHLTELPPWLKRRQAGGLHIYNKRELYNQAAASESGQESGMRSPPPWLKRPRVEAAERFGGRGDDNLQRWPENPDIQQTTEKDLGSSRCEEGANIPFNEITRVFVRRRDQDDTDSDRYHGVEPVTATSEHLAHECKERLEEQKLKAKIKSIHEKNIKLHQRLREKEGEYCRQGKDAEHDGGAKTGDLRFLLEAKRRDKHEQRDLGVTADER